MVKQCIVVCIMLIICSVTYGQNKAVPLGQWRTHLPYHDCRVLTETPEKIYAASEIGFFSLEKNGGNIERLSKINGFSDVLVSTLKYSPDNDVVVIAYDNCKIDIVKNNTITPIDDIYRKVILGIKKINHIAFYQNLAYLSTSFGIIVIDLDKLEIKDSYLDIGPGGTKLGINATTTTADSIYAATAIGILAGKLSQSVNLSDYNNWHLSRAGLCEHLCAYNNKLFADNDSVVYVYSGGTWQPFDGTSKKFITNIDVFHNRALVATWGKCTSEDMNGQRTDYAINILNYALLDNDYNIWYGNPLYGLIKKVGNDESGFLPNGPKSYPTYKMLSTGNELWVTSGGRSNNFGPIFSYNRYYHFTGSEWQNAGDNAITDPIYDWTEVVQNPANKNIYFGSHGKGIVEFVNGQPNHVFDETNSPLRKFGNLYTIVSGLAYDKNNRLWVSNYGVDSPFHVRLTNGKWVSYKFPQTSSTGAITIDGKGYKWILTPRESTGGVLVFDDRGTPENYNDDRSVMLSTSSGNGNLPSQSISCLAYTAKGEIWVGSDLGLSVIRNPSNVFANPAMLADRIIVSVEAGTNLGGYLLGSEVINCITLDGADRRWVGTNDGAWLIDNDGTTILQHFTTDNTPILSNTVMSIGIVEQTGEVFFGTDKGLVSYRGDATKPEKNLEHIKIFPNPVKENFDGQVSISGLSDNTLVKITDINGNLVYETTSNGGTATWNCRKFNGERPATGVYLAFCINSDGTQTNMGKILFIH